jgi:plastocyanin
MRLFSAVLLAAAACVPMAVGLTVEVLDRNGEPVEGAVVTLTPAGKFAAPAPGKFELVQSGQSFVPRVLVVPAGSTVRFPNRDNVAHHVYSFSEVKKFDLPLYVGGAESPEVVFDRAGVVALGCNIHDWMVGHVFVTDAPFHAMTGPDGRAEVKGPGGRVEVWHPRLIGAPVAVDGASGSGVVRVDGLRLRPDFRRRQAPVAAEAAGGYR